MYASASHLTRRLRRSIYLSSTPWLTLRRHRRAISPTHGDHEMYLYIAIFTAADRSDGWQQC